MYIQLKKNLKKTSIKIQTIFFAEMDGKSDIVCYRNMANFIVNESWYK